MSAYSREDGQPMSTEHKRPLLAFVAVFVVAMVVVAGAARSDALRHLVQERTVDIVAATALDVVGEPEPRLVVAAPEGDVSGTESVSSSSTGGAVKDKAGKGKAGEDKAAKGQAGAGQAKGHAHAKAPGKAKGHAHAKAPGRAKGHAHAQPPGQVKGHGPATSPGKAKGHAQGKGHAKARGKGHHKHGH